MWDQNTEKLGVTGHRGCRAYVAENTLESFREAFRYDVDVLEFDIHFSRDKRLVVMHDTMVDRTTDGHGDIHFKTLEEIKQLDAGVKFGTPGLRVPTFREALECISAEASERLLLNVEIKDQRPDVIDAAVAELKAFGLAERSVIASFDAQSLLYVKKYYPEMKFQGQPPQLMTNYDEAVLDGMFGMGVPVGNAKMPSDEEIAAVVKLANDHGIQAWGYQADDRAAVERCMKFNFTNLTANAPKDLIAYLDETGRRVGK